MKNPCIILDSVVCQARYHACRMFCPRSIYPYWREIWLERVEERPATAEDMARTSPRAARRRWLFETPQGRHNRLTQGNKLFCPKEDQEMQPFISDKIKRVLCLGAHSDDIDIGCGGILLKIAPGKPRIWVRSLDRL